MMPGSRTFRTRLVLIALVSVAVFLSISGQGASPLPSTVNGEWPYYTADLRGSKYSPLDQINASNFSQLEVAWRFKTDSLGSRPEYKLEGTPLMVNGVVYATGGTRRSVVALDAKTGELLWVHSYREGHRAAVAPRQLSGRGVSYWTDGKGDDRILYVTTGYRLIALNAHTGQMIPSFGNNGVVDLKQGVVFGTGEQIDLETGEIGLHSTPTVVKDVILVGSSMQEGAVVPTHNNTKGLVRAFDVRTGRMLWRYDTIPKPGEFGNDTWEKDSWAVNGNTGVWTQITVDEDLGLVYLPVEDPTEDYYGGHRPGNNLFADSLVCVDLKTGQRKWYYQLVHHPIWDFDISSAPLLIDATINGVARKIVAQPTKQVWLYTFDRVTGQPIWPIEERPVPQSDVPGERTSPTQPFPTKPPAYARNYLSRDDVIDFTPEMRAQGLEALTHYRWEQTPFVPYVVGKRDGIRGAINLGNSGGGTNWPGASFDPETHIVYAQANNSQVTTGSLRQPPADKSDLRYVSGIEGSEFRYSVAAGFGTAADIPNPTTAASTAPGPRAGGPATPPRGEGFFGEGNNLNVQGLSIVKPPYGVLSAIDMDRGELKWQVPHGDTPDAVRNHPALKGMNIPKTGQGGSVGLMVTKTLVILGDPQVTTTPQHPRGAMLRAYDKQTGREVGAVWMPAPQSGSPMTYMVDGKQYIIVAVSGGNYSGEYLAFALPANARTQTQSGK
jgi:glucose dehydrogenase